MKLMRNALLLTGSAAVLAGCSGKEAPRPNVILILADDIGYGDLGCYGAIGVETPNVDSLASRGIRFTNTHAAASTSTPSRYGLLTGQYPWRKDNTDIAAGNAGMIIDPDCYTVADMFKSAGYNTCAFGKWHLGLGSETGTQDWNGILDKDLHDIGFDHYYIMAATADRVPCVFIEDGKVVDYDPEAPIQVSYESNFDGEPTLMDNPALAYNLQSSEGHNMSIVNGIGRIGYMKGGGKALWKDENIADSITVNATRYIENSGDEPFFMYFATNDIHVPRWPAERFRGASTMGLRGDAIAQFDWSVGKIVAALKRTGKLENTIILLTSDNGPVLDDGYCDRAVELVGEHSPTGHLRGGKYSAFEGGTMVPAIIVMPESMECSMEADRLISHIDYFRTAADFLGVELPEGAAPDSRNYRDRTYVIEESHNHTLSIRDAEWKYICPSDSGKPIAWGTGIETGHLPVPQLYRMDGDICEMMNVAEQNPDIVKRFEEILASEQ